MPPITVENIFFTKNQSKKRLLRLITKNDYQDKDTERLGNLFGIIDIDLGQNQQIKIFDVVEEGISQYYKSSLDYDLSFADFINFLNRRFDQFNISKKDINVVLGVTKDNQVIFAVNGAIFVYFIYPQGIKKIYPEEKEEYLDVNDKIFPFTLGGQILKNYLIYFCNNDFNNFADPLPLERALRQMGVKTSLQLFRDALAKEEKIGGAAFFISREEPKEKKEGLSAVNFNLSGKREESSDLSTLKKDLKIFFRKNKILFYLIKNFGKFFKKIIGFGKKILLFILSVIFNLFFIATNWRGKRLEKQKILETKVQLLEFKILDFYRSLTLTSKIIFGALVILIILFASAIKYNLYLNEIKKLKLDYEKIYASAETLKDEASSDLLLKENNKAQNKLKSALFNMGKIDPRVRDQNYNALYDKIKKTLYQLQNISEITMPTLLSDFDLEGIVIYPPLYSLEKDEITIGGENEIIKINTKTGGLKRNKFTIAQKENLNYYYQPTKIFYTLENENILHAFDSLNLTSQLKEITLHPKEQIKIFNIYNDNLYALSLAEKYFSLWKHAPSLSGFGKPLLSLTDNLPDGSPLLSLAIDGNVYVLFRNNEINKYYRGTKQAWSYQAGNAPEGVKYFKIITGDNYKNIYLLDKKWVSVLAKDGNFLAHIFLPAADIEDALIDETEKTIYFLSGKKIYVFAFEMR